MADLIWPNMKIIKFLMVTGLSTMMLRVLFLEFPNCVEPSSHIQALLRELTREFLLV